MNAHDPARDKRLSSKGKGSVNYQYDLIDITRQSISDQANQVLNEVSRAYHKKDLVTYSQKTEEFLDLVSQQDRLLAQCEDFTLDKWVERAEQAGHTPEEKALYRKNALMMITVWGDEAASEAGGLHEYSHREWSGLLE